MPQDNTCDHECKEPPYSGAEAIGVCCPKTKFGENEGCVAIHWNQSGADIITVVAGAVLISPFCNDFGTRDSAISVLLAFGFHGPVLWCLSPTGSEGSGRCSPVRRVKS